MEILPGHFIADLAKNSRFRAAPGVDSVLEKTPSITEESIRQFVVGFIVVVWTTNGRTNLCQQEGRLAIFG